MPEGDTLHKAAIALRPVLVGKVLAQVFDHGLERKGMAGRAVNEVRAQGKHLLVELEGGATIHVHLGMTGKVWAEPRARMKAWTPRSASLVLLTDAAAVSVMKAPVVEFLKTAFVKSHPVIARLGPDLLATEVDFDHVLRRARSPAVADTPIAEVLLDQRVSSGIGNVYKSEVLFIERVNPHTTPRALDDEELLGLFRRASELMRMNLRVGPRVTTANRQRDELPKGGRGRFHVYNRRGRGCFVCGTPIKSELSGLQARSTFWCPVCQPEMGQSGV